MNWVGGSRNRVMMKNDAKKQREFFEKKKKLERLKNLGIALPKSPPGSCATSMDLVNLFIVNQIAAKKEKKAPPKVAVFGSNKGHRRQEPLVLPMSPCPASQLSLVESQSQYSFQGTRKTNQVIPQLFRCRQLSPVQESAFSDCSAPDFIPPAPDLLSPFSSTSSACSGRTGLFPPRLKLHQSSQPPLHCSPPPWDPSRLTKSQFQPYCQPGNVTNPTSWSCGSDPGLHHQETSAETKILFGSPESEHRIRPEVMFSLNQAEDREPVLHFTLSQSEPELQIREDIFRGFGSEEYESEAPHHGKGLSKIYLNDETVANSSTPQTVPDPQCMVELSNCSHVNFSCLQHDNDPMNGCACSPSCSCSRGYLSSDSSEQDDCCLFPSLQAKTSRACCENTNVQTRDQRSLQKPASVTGGDGEAAERDEAVGSDSPRACETCKSKKAPGRTCEVGTQTPTESRETADASTQCGVTWSPPPVDEPEQCPATGGQPDTTSAAEPNRQGTGAAGGRHTPWSRRRPSRVVNKARKSDGKAATQRRCVSPQYAPSETESKEQQEVQAATKSLKEAETLQEIADILLLLKQREK